MLDAVMRSKTVSIRLMIWCCLAAATSTTSADEPKPAPLRMASTARSTGCSTADVALDQLRSRHKQGYAYIVGRVTNNCDIETGVQIKVAILDHAGKVLRVADFWPASTDNIPAHSGFSFQTEIEGVDTFDRFQVSVIEVKRWK